VMNFDCYKDSQRIYDAFSNAWDCCSEFEFSPRNEDEMDSDDDGPYRWFNSREKDPQPISLPPLLPISPERPPSSSLADVPIIVEGDPPSASLPGLSISPERPPSSLLPPLAHCETRRVVKNNSKGCKVIILMERVVFRDCAL